MENKGYKNGQPVNINQDNCGEILNQTKKELEHGIISHDELGDGEITPDPIPEGVPYRLAGLLVGDWMMCLYGDCEVEKEGGILNWIFYKLGMMKTYKCKKCGARYRKIPYKDEKEEIQDSIE